MSTSRPSKTSQHTTLWTLVVIALSLLSILALPRLRVDTDLAALLPQGSPAAEAYQTYVERFGGFEKVFVLITAPTPGDAATDPLDDEDRTADLLDAARQLAETLQQAPEIADVRAGLSPDDESFVLRQVLPRAPLLLEDEALERLAARLEPESIARRVRQLRAALRTPAGDFQRLVAIHDPLNLAGDLRQPGPFSMPVDLLSSGFLSSDSQASLVMITPSGAEIDPESGKKLRAAIQSASQSVQQRIGRPLEFRAVGGSLYAAYDEELLRGDLQKTVTGSLLICSLLLFAAFSGWRLPTVCMAVLGLGLLWTVGWLAFLVERISAVGLGFAAVLVGLGIDYAIHGGARFQQARLGGLGGADALRAARRDAGPAIIASALTTAAAFSTLLLAHFRPLHEIGLLVAGGIATLLLATWAMAEILPARLGAARPAHGASRVWTWLGRLADRSIHHAGRHPVPVLIVAALLTLFGLVGLVDLGIDPDLRALRPAGHPLADVEEDLARFFDLGAETSTLLIHGEDAGTALDRASRVTARLRAALGPEADLTSPSDWLIGQRAERRLTALAALPFAAAATHLEDELRRANLAPAAFASGLETLRAYAQRRDPVADNADRPAWLSELIRQDGDGTWLALRLRLPHGVWETGPPADLVDDIAQLAPGLQWASAPLLGAELRQVATRDARRLDTFALLGVLLVVLISFRGRPRPAALALVPVFLGTVWTLGLWSLAGRSLDLLSLSVLPILLGIGVDDGLHAVHGRGHAIDNIRQAGRAMTLTTLTTAAGFGSLALSQVPGLRAGGQIVAFGVLCCWAATLWVLPALASIAPTTDRNNG